MTWVGGSGHVYEDDEEGTHRVWDCPKCDEEAAAQDAPTKEPS